ncbi:MAG: hypothetical protein IPF67_18020 [Saprospiraceae bacterium]|nr:hypothetical protein [Candidatus Brachybacter algidus]
MHEGKNEKEVVAKQMDKDWLLVALIVRKTPTIRTLLKATTDKYPTLL